MPGAYPWFKMFADDWYNCPETRAMTKSQRGEYIDALVMIWRTKECGIPAVLFETLYPELKTFIGNGYEVLRRHPENNDLVTNSKLFAQFEAQNVISKSLSDRGKKRKKPRLSRGKATAKPTDSDSSSSLVSKIRRLSNTMKYTPGYKMFWSVYPRKESKAYAFHSYCQRPLIQLAEKNPDKDLPVVDQECGEIMVDRVERDLNRPEGMGLNREKKYLPLASTYLNQRRYMDDDEDE